jgi:hypothetical protein
MSGRDRFFDIELDVDPDLIFLRGMIFEDTLVAFLPNVPDSKSRKQLSGSIYDGVAKGRGSPMSDGGSYRISNAIGGAKEQGSLVPDVGGVGASAEKVVDGFFQVR